MAPVNVMNLNSDEIKEFVASFDHLFSDCDGVIWHPNPIPAAGELYRLMESQGKTVNYVSNCSLRSRSNYESLFKGAGIEKGYERLTIPSIAIAEYLKSLNFNKKIYCVCGQEAVNVLQSYGFTCEQGPNLIEFEDFTPYFAQFMEDNEEIGAVILDSDLAINLAKVFRAKTYLMRSDVLFIVGATDKLHVQKPGRVDPGPAIFVSILEELLDRKALVIGKPAKLYGEMAMKKAGVTNASKVLFIGDMIEQDVGVGKAMGFKTLLILSSISEKAMMASRLQPDYYVPSMESLLSKISSCLL